jgi:phosphatidylserine/phosphatidylglycerophosphate/cardiolipin synthase-like enzyme
MWQPWQAKGLTRFRVIPRWNAPSENQAFPSTLACAGPTTPRPRSSQTPGGRWLARIRWRLQSGKPLSGYIARHASASSRSSHCRSCLYLQPIRDMYIEAIDRAEQSILLTNASFVPDHSMLEALQAAVARGVDVRVLVPWPSNRTLADRVTCSSFTQCLQAGMRLYCSRQEGLRSKTCTIDGQWSTIGNAHLDLLSSVVNYELNIEIYDVAFAIQMQDLFARDIADAYELSLTKWLSRPWYRKLSEHMLAPFRFLL